MKRAVLLQAIVFSCLAVGACGDSRAGAMHHPQQTYVATGLEPTGAVVLGELDSLPTDFQEIVQAITQPSSTAIGALESPAHEVFGEVADVAVDDSGRIYVLDSRSSDVRLFDSVGRFLTRFGGPGRGPGEFANPLSLSLGPAHHVYVSDLTRHVHLFEARGATYQYVRSLPLKVAALDMCLLNGVLMVHGINLDETRLIHAYDSAGALIRSFGTVYRSRNPDINFALSKGRLICDADRNLVVFAPASGISEVVAYDTTGRPVWRTSIGNYRPIAVTEISGGFGVEVPSSGFHRIQAFTYVPSGHILLQFALVTRESQTGGRPFVGLSTVVLRSESGHGAYAGDSLPIVTALGPAGYVQLHEDPFPRLDLHPLRYQR